MIKRNLFRDILRDSDSKKFSMTKFAALVTLTLLIIAVGSAIWIMIDGNEIDYILIGELIGLLLTLLGFKTARDRKKLDIERERMRNNTTQSKQVENTLDHHRDDELG